MTDRWWGEITADFAEHRTHQWVYSNFSYDFGEKGVRSRVCAICELRQETDPFTGAWQLDSDLRDVVQ